jgi:Tfp pilus assembly protein PilF
MTAPATAKTRDFSAEAVECFARQEFDKAAVLLGECLLQQQTSELWNDWATARFFAGRSVEAEGGYQRALEMNPQNAQAAENLGALLAGQGRAGEASSLLETAMSLAGGKASPALTQLLVDNRKQAANFEKDDRRPMAASYNGLTRAVTLQSLALDRTLFRLTTLSAEVNEATDRILKAMEDIKMTERNPRVVKMKKAARSPIS